MIDLTPLDVRNKRGDFRKKLGGGYDPQEVDTFLELVADRLEDLVRQGMLDRERLAALEKQVSSQSGRERAVQEALVTAQELRADIKGSAQREAELILAEAQAEARRQLAEAEAQARAQLRDAERQLEAGRDAIVEMERRRARFLKSFRQLLEREMDVVEVEEERPPLEERPIEMDLGGGRPASVREDVERLFLDAPPAAEPQEMPFTDMVIEEVPLDDVIATPDMPEGAWRSASPDDPDVPRMDDAALAAAAAVGAVSITPPDVDERPPLDASVDELAREYPPTEDESDADGAESRGDAGASPPPVGDRGLFALPDTDDDGDEDTRWG